MPAGALGTSWETGSWPDTAWEAGSWDDLADIVVAADVIIRIRGHHGVNQGSAFTIQDGGLVVQDPDDAVVYQCDWDAEALGASASLGSSTWTATAIRPSTATALTVAQNDIVESNRQAQVRLSGGLLGATYRIDNTITTNEAPTQTVERSFFLKIEQQ